MSAPGCRSCGRPTKSLSGFCWQHWDMAPEAQEAMKAHQLTTRQFDVDHSMKLLEILGLLHLGHIPTKMEMEQAIDDLYGRMFPDLTNQQHEQEYDHE
jgi:hypothetical protein